MQVEPIKRRSIQTPRMVEDYGLSALDAYELLSVAMESNVSQLVDPNYSVLVKIRKEYLPTKKKAQ